MIKRRALQAPALALRGLLAERPWLVTSSVSFVVGLGLLFLAPGMIVATLVEWGSSTSHNETALGMGAAATLLAGAGLVVFTRLEPDMSPATVFATVAWTWVGSSLFGALPFWFSGEFGSFDNALFESVSGYTATGSTILSQIEGVGRGVLMWRQIIQWYGGMGMVVLAVTILPFLGVGGLSLISAETPGPMSSRLAPQVSSTARRLWALYGGFTIAVAVALKLAGLSLYDATAHAFTTASTGGFSPYNASIGHFNNLAVEVIIIVGMLACGISFTLHWRAITGSPRAYGESSEFRFYLLAILLTALVAASLNWLNDISNFVTSLRNGLFNAVTLGTSTGFSNASGSNTSGDFAVWTAGAQSLLLPLMVMGGMTGSTAGGLKVLRAQVMAKYMRVGLLRVKHPHVVARVKLGSRALSESVLQRVAGLVALYAFTAFAGTLVLSMLGQDLITSSSGTISALGNMGPALGEAGPTSNFLVFTRPSRVVLMLLMLIGRLEFFAILLVVIAAYERVRRTARVKFRH
ncbi:MAG: TrkH family potassium uptake protein [Acidimicrobiia bacterium]|nr:TrkH family potassium uptake protein [Acidimicrobiia bacterium]MYG94269.1 TrkH family potassium uptake protein [Acidimicrobiia bacterium]MYI30383.1 TrkH family potassium uptake protein [Acidimicrobiia bacterium]